MTTPLRANDFGKNRILAEDCKKIRIEDVVKKTNRQLKAILLQANVSAIDVELELTTTILCSGGLRYWFKCPVCKKRIGVLFQHPIEQVIGCRTCLHLDYLKHRYKGMIEESIQNN
ncbi:MAG: hypothetical protein HYV32_03090 [Candidatus Kerfeldbacteria bacterium]|nr:hypothetical protein [Candidatus Kerfeldbacteria bacterium]